MYKVRRYVQNEPNYELRSYLYWLRNKICMSGGLKTPSEEKVFKELYAPLNEDESSRQYATTIALHPIFSSTDIPTRLFVVRRLRTT